MKMARLARIDRRSTSCWAHTARLFYCCCCRLKVPSKNCPHAHTSWPTHPRAPRWRQPNYPLRNHNRHYIPFLTAILSSQRHLQSSSVTGYTRFDFRQPPAAGAGKTGNRNRLASFGYPRLQVRPMGARFFYIDSPVA